MQKYLDLMREVIEKGERKPDRTNTGTISLFAAKLNFDLTKTFPLITTKRIYIKGVIHELLWFLNGDTNIKYLNENAVSIWDEWSDEEGDLGRIYGAQWISWKKQDGTEVNQIKNVIHSLKTNPSCRRHIVSAWNVGEINEMSLPPCHLLFQFYVSQDGGLSCQIYQRSVDVFLGLPFNIASYAFLTHIIAQQAGLYPKELIWIGGDTHLYINHLDQAREQMSRKPLTRPTLTLRKRDKYNKYQESDFEIKGYHPHKAIKAQIAV